MSKRFSSRKAPTSNEVPSIEVKTRKVNSGDVREMNRVREINGAKTIAMVSTEGFTRKAREELERQGTVCINIPASVVRRAKN